MATENSPKFPTNFYCEKCDYATCHLNDFNKHLLTLKHKRQQMATKKSLKVVKPFICKNCDKSYQDRSGLWKHNKKCISENNIYNEEKNEENKNKEKDNEKEKISELSIVMEVIKQNQEILKSHQDVIKQMQNLYKNVSNTNNVLINNNCNNKTFNLNLFLNEECKDAMNIMDFVDSLKIQLTDLEKVGELGYVNGLSNIIINNLKALDIHKRPVHCSDTKRETIYIKDANRWEKENDEKIKLNKAIKSIANKNICLITKWKENNPDCICSESFKSDQYNDIVLNSLDTDKASNQRIIKNIVREIKIEKE
jgi:hypothetical protein